MEKLYLLPYFVFNKRGFPTLALGISHGNFSFKYLNRVFSRYQNVKEALEYIEARFDMYHELAASEDSVQLQLRLAMLGKKLNHYDYLGIFIAYCMYLEDPNDAADAEDIAMLKLNQLCQIVMNTSFFDDALKSERLMKILFLFFQAFDNQVVRCHVMGFTNVFTIQSTYISVSAFGIILMHAVAKFPDWCMHSIGLVRATGRKQLVQSICIDEPKTFMQKFETYIGQKKAEQEKEEEKHENVADIS